MKAFEDGRGPRLAYSSSNSAWDIGMALPQLSGVSPKSWGIHRSWRGSVRSSTISRLHGAGREPPGSDAEENGVPGDAVPCGPLMPSEVPLGEPLAEPLGASKAASSGEGGPAGGNADPGPPTPAAPPEPASREAPALLALARESRSSGPSL